jgi:alpha-N-arabinofuranosidase
MRKSSLFFFLSIVSACLFAQKPMTVYAGRPGPSVSPTMWGIFFEDINFGADGGLYAELVKNRSFEFPLPMTGWKEIKKSGTGKILVVNQENENPSNPRYAHLSVDADQGWYGISNESFRGLGIQKKETYQFSLLARSKSGLVKMQIEVVNFAGEKIVTASLDSFSTEWKRYSVSLTASDTVLKGRLNIWLEGKGEIDMDMVSLFPQHTWKDRSNGLRKDLVQWLADMKPGFLRFPGGCIVEGRDLTNRYQWKNTVGAMEQRKLIMNRWNVEFPRRSAPDYYQTFGLGFFEYFQLAEDIGAEPLPIINCGMACQFNSAEVVALTELDPFIQDALDLVEFANGDLTTKWGKLRGDMGHPLPFHLKLLGIGNEQWEIQYIDRFKRFEKILKQRYPQIKLVAAAGPSPDGARFDFAWKELRQLNADLVDEHYYQSPEWFYKNASRYDQYDRKGPKVFAGEYAAHGKEELKAESKNTWLSALAEAAFMTGLERNADVVQMASYAPLFAHVDAWQWRPDLIWFDNLRSVGTPNYYVQKLFATNSGSFVLPVLQDQKIIAGQDSVYASSVLDEKSKTIIIKLVNTSHSVLVQPIVIDGKLLKDKASITILGSADPLACNTLEEPAKVLPMEQSAPVKKNTVTLSLTPMSLTVVRIPLK